MEKKLKNYVRVILLLLLSSNTYAQKEDIIGFWAIEKVKVGEENMTPVAKWTRINADGSYQTGNGWLQNGQGHWNYDSEKNLYSAKDFLDVADKFGGFSVSFEHDKMIWQREEEGMQVKVTLVPIEKLPMSPADYLEGIWDLVEITDKEQSVLDDFDKHNKHKIFIRWDRIYINFSPEGNRLTGYWHIHGHRPEITFLPHQESEKPESWKIKVDDRELIMSGISDNNQNIKRKYVRRKTY